MSALFYLDHRFNLDVGAQQSAARFWNAGSYVGLSSKELGTVRLGRRYVPIFWSFLFADDTGPMRMHGYSALQSVQRSNFARISAAASPIKAAGSLDSIAGGVYSASITSAFEDNLVVYKSPSFGGATVMLAAGAPEGYLAGSGKVFAIPRASASAITISCRSAPSSTPPTPRSTTKRTPATRSTASRPACWVRA